MKVIQVLAPYGPLFLADRYRPGFVPWAERTASHVTGRKAHTENTTPPVPEHILQPLLAGTVYLVETIGPHCAETYERLRAHSREAAGLSNPARLGAARLAQFEAAADELRAGGAPLPRSSDTIVRQRLAEGWDRQDPLLRVHVNQIAHHAGLRRLPASQLPFMRPVLEAAVAQVGVAGWWARDATLVPRADTGEPVPWTEPMTAEEIHRTVG